MSSPVRLLLVSSTPGADTAAVAASACEELSGSGREPMLIAPGSPAIQDLYRSTWSMLAEAVGAILQGLGMASLSVDEVGTLPGLGELAFALAACKAADTSGSLVVWDAGPWESSVRSVSSIGAASHLLERLMTPTTAARVHSGGTTAMEAVAALRAAEARLAQSAVSWVVAGPGRQQAVKRATAALGIWEIPVAQVVDAQGADASTGRMQQEPLPTSRCQMRWVEETPDGFLLGLRLPMIEREALRVGRAGPSVIIAMDEWRRVIRLPAALQRCVVEGAGLEGGVLTIRLRPDPLAWPLRNPAETGAGEGP